MSVYELATIALSAVVSFLIAEWTVSRTAKEDRKARREATHLEVCASIVSLMSMVESDPSQRTDDSFATELCRVSHMARLRASNELSEAIGKYAAEYLRAFKVFKANSLVLYDMWHTLEGWEDADGNPLNPELNLVEEEGESRYLSERQKLEDDFLFKTSGLCAQERKLCEMALDEAAGLAC